MISDDHGMDDATALTPEHRRLFDGERYFDVTAEYAKAAPEDVLIRITVVHRALRSHLRRRPVLKLKVRR